jgi:hypothetical protein
MFMETRSKSYMTRIVLEDSTLESLTPSVNAPLKDALVIAFGFHSHLVPLARCHIQVGYGSGP